MTGFSVTRYQWMDNVICHHIYCKHSVSGGQINVLRNLNMHRPKSVEKPK